MEILIDDKQYRINMKKPLNYLKDKLANGEQKGLNSFQLPNGQKVNLGINSVVRVALNASLATILYPIIENLYESKGIPLPKHDRKKEDFLLYASICIINLLISFEKDISLYAESIKDDRDGIYNITTVSTIRKFDVKSIGNGGTRGTQEIYEEGQSEGG